jgi:nardilysin
VLADLADQVLFEPLYDALRTKQQLGYTVSSGTRLTHGVSGFCVVVVSAAFGAATVEARIEGFLQQFGDTSLQVRLCGWGASWGDCVCGKQQRRQRHSKRPGWCAVSPAR